MPTRSLVIPVKKFTPSGGVFRFPKLATLRPAEPADRVPLEQLAVDLGAKAGVVPEVIPHDLPLEACVRMERQAGPSQAYRLEISGGGIVIRSADAAGAYYAVQTLRNLLGAGGEVPCGVVEDFPVLRRRGFMHDLSRGKVPKLSTLKRLVEILAHYKINELQLYIEHTFQFAGHPKIGAGFSPLSAGDIAELQAHCRKHHVELVGNLVSFSHMERTLEIPGYEHLGELPGYRGLPGGTTLSPEEPGSLKLIGERMREFVPLFDAVNFNINCDEPWELGQGKSKAKCDRLGKGKVYLDFVVEVYRIVKGLGKRVNAWADILLEHPELLKDLPRDLVLLNWEYSPNGKFIARTHEITDKGLACVVCPGTNSWNSHGTRYWMGQANTSNFAREGARVGAEGILTTDWGDNGHRNMLAVSLAPAAWGAACGWEPEADAAGFASRFSRDLFGCDLGTAIEMLGSAHEKLHLPLYNDTALYGMLLRTTPPTHEKLVRDIGTMSPRDLEVHHHALEDVATAFSVELPAGSVVGDEVFLEEYELACRLDAFCCEKTRRYKRDGVLVPVEPALLEKARSTWMKNNRPTAPGYGFW